MTHGVAGVDGARNGWVVAEVSATDEITVRFEHSIDSIVKSVLAGELDAAVVDMPIGLSENGSRPADREARSRLGSRRSTFFPTPVRCVLDHDVWHTASEASRLASGKGLSKQAWNLVPKIREVDAAWSNELKERLVEGHPEVSFAEMAGEPVMTKKTDEAGRADRLALLSAHLDPDITTLIDTCEPAWTTDAVDALALAWTARRLVRGQALVLGGQLDAMGRPMQLVI